MAISLGALELGASHFAIGLLLSFYGLLPMFLSVASGRWIDRVGLRTPLIGGAALTFLGVVVPFLAWDIGSMYLAAVTIGLGSMAYYLAVQKACGLIGGESARTANFSLMALGYSISGFLGPTTAGVGIDLIGHRAVFALLAAAALVTLVGSKYARFMKALPETPAPVVRPGEPPGRVSDLLATPELKRLYLAVAVLSAAWDVHQFLVPLYGAKLGISASQIGLILGAFSIATFLVRMALPRLARRIGDWPLVLTAMAIAALVYMAYPLHPVLPSLLALSFLLGLGLGVAQPMIMVVLYRVSPPTRLGEAAGLRMTLINGTQTFLPSTFGAFGAAFGLSAVFWCMALLIAAGGAHIAHGLRRAGRR